jgi:hypothetical protein
MTHIERGFCIQLNATVGGLVDLLLLLSMVVQ